MRASTTAAVSIRLTARVTPGALKLFEDLMWLRQRKPLVYSNAYLAERHHVSLSTIRRWRSELRRKGLAIGLYNGGRGKRCIEYVGPRAVERAMAEHTIEWPAKSRLGTLRLGRIAMQKQPKKDLENEILTAPASSYSERGAPSEPPPSENLRPAPPVAEEAAPQGTPSQSPPAPPGIADQERPKPEEAPTRSQATGSPPRGAERPRGKGARRTNSIAKNRPNLWRRAWGIWRAFAAHARGVPQKEHPADQAALSTLLALALLRFRGDDELAMDDLAWGMRLYLSDPALEFRPLAKLRRLRESYGRAPPDYHAPRSEGEATRTDPRIVRQLARDAIRSHNREVAELGDAVLHGTGKRSGAAPAAQWPLAAAAGRRPRPPAPAPASSPSSPPPKPPAAPVPLPSTPSSSPADPMPWPLTSKRLNVERLERELGEARKALEFVELGAKNGRQVPPAELDRAGRLVARLEYALRSAVLAALPGGE